MRSLCNAASPYLPHRGSSKAPRSQEKQVPRISKSHVRNALDSTNSNTGSDCGAPVYSCMERRPAERSTGFQEFQQHNRFANHKPRRCCEHVIHLGVDKGFCFGCPTSLAADIRQEIRRSASSGRSSRPHVHIARSQPPALAETCRRWILPHDVVSCDLGPPF